MFLTKAHLFFNISKFSNNLATQKYLTSYALQYLQYGEPSKVIEKVDISTTVDRPLNNDEILVEFLASPINPADINTIQGVYAIKPQLPAIGGNEAVAKVIGLGKDVSNLQESDWVLPTVNASGTWRNHGIYKRNELIKIRNDIDIVSASQLKVNPCTAYRMLKDFVPLNSGVLYFIFNFSNLLILDDSIIQNGANSAVGIFAIQIAKQWGVKTINVVRNRANLDELKSELFNYGATYVITEEEMRQSEVTDKIFKEIPKPKLAMNCVGGKNATDCMRLLGFRGTMVTYGGMSKQPLIAPTGSLIFKDHRFVGFWMSRWYDEVTPEVKSDMLTEICDLFKAGKMKGPKTIEVPLDDYKVGLENAMKGFSNAKYVFVFNK